MTFQNVMDCFISKKWSIGFHPHSRQVESLNYSLRKFDFRRVGHLTMDYVCFSLVLL